MVRRCRHAPLACVVRRRVTRRHVCDPKDGGGAQRHLPGKALGVWRVGGWGSACREPLFTARLSAALAGGRCPRIPRRAWVLTPTRLMALCVRRPTLSDGGALLHELHGHEPGRDREEHVQVLGGVQWSWGGGKGTTPLAASRAAPVLHFRTSPSTNSLRRAAARAMATRQQQQSSVAAGHRAFPPYVARCVG